MKTLLVKFFNPDEVMDITPETIDEEIKKCCFIVSKYETPFECLEAYANTQATWSTILDEDDNYYEFINNAYEHIKQDDYDWLEQHFV